MKVCVSGASGFLGKYVLSELLNRKVEIIPLIRTNRNAKLLSNYQNLKIIDHHDINSYKKNKKLFSENLIHLAWSGLPNYQSDEHILKELPSQFEFLEHLIKLGVKNITVAGTCLEYGMRNGCLNESMKVNPKNPYGIAKEYLYRKLQNLKKVYSFNLQWCRIFYVYGKGQHKNSLWSQISKAVENKKFFFEMSGGEQIRDFMHVNDVAHKLVSLHLMGSDVGIVNICSAKPISVKKIVNTWIENNQWNIVPKYHIYPYTEYEPMSFWGSNTKLNNLLG